MLASLRSSLASAGSLVTRAITQTTHTSVSSGVRAYHVTRSSVPDFIDALKSQGQHRAFVVTDPDSGNIVASHPILQPVADFYQENKGGDYLGHEGTFMEISPRTGALMTAFVHVTNRGQAAGGIRLWPYEHPEGFLRDGLRLSTGMGRKNALAGLWWGGGKGVVVRPPGDDYLSPEWRDLLFEDYGDFLTSLQGCYVSAEDVGLNVDDLDRVHRRTRFTTCISPSIGGSGNPSIATALGVVCSMEGALAELNQGTLQGKRIACEGAGNVSIAMMEYLVERGVESIVASDINPTRAAFVREHFANKGVDNVNIIVVKPGDPSIYSADVDIVAPNALGGTLNPDTIPTIKAGIVCGAANNQLLDAKRDSALLQQQGIVFVPDYVCNRMGIVNCANEAYGYPDNDDYIQRHFSRDWENSCFVITRKVLSEAASRGVTTTEAAETLADQAALEPHPIFGASRSKSIIRGLVRNNWHLGGRA